MAGKVFNNGNEISQYFNRILPKIVDAVSDHLLDNFLEHLEKTIYAAPSSEYYERYEKKGGFYAGWEITTEQRKDIGDYVKSLIFDGNKLISPSTDMRNGQMTHGGSDGSDIRNLMPEVLNDITSNIIYSYSDGAKYFDGNIIGYWDSYIKGLDKKVNNWFKDELKKYGIEI